MSGIKCFWMKPIPEVRVTLRVYRPSGGEPCAAGRSWCEAVEVVIAERAPQGEWMVRSYFEGDKRMYWRTFSERVSHDDPRWPVARCDWCDRDFSETAIRQVNAHQLHSGSPDGKLYTLWNEPVGAMWDCDWLKSDNGGDWGYTGPDGITLCVRTPGGLWMVDSQASNCDRKQEVPAPTAEHPNAHRFVRTHYCWVRHGDPRSGNIHVDKDAKRAGVETCGAGAGSILIAKYHGFLRGGYLTDA